jgi:DUF4097 and DUF4098 domain-containing protein YvlB
MRPAKLSATLTALVLGTALLAQAPPPPPPPEPPAPPAIPDPPASGPSRLENRTEKLNFGSKLWVKNRNGSIKVTGWNKEEVSLKAEIRDNEQRPINLVVQRKGADLDIEAVSEQSKWHLSFEFARSPYCQMTLSVPQKLLGHFRTTNGSVSVVNLEGYARCETTNGNVTLKEIQGEVLAETTNGTIDARKLNARIKGGTTNGRILLEDVLGGIKMETTNGSIVARNLDGWGEGISLETTNGSIELELGKATGDLDAGNTHGSLDIKVPAAQIVELSKHSAKLKIPGKAQRIVLDTTNGSIKVR